MKKSILAVFCTCFCLSIAFAQNNNGIVRTVPPQNADALAKSIAIEKVPTQAEGQPIVLDAKAGATTTATQMRNEDLPPEKRKIVRKGFDVKSGQVLYREVISREELEARRQQRAEVKAKAAQTKD